MVALLDKVRGMDIGKREIEVAQHAKPFLIERAPLGRVAKISSNDAYLRALGDAALVEIGLDQRFSLSCDLKTSADCAQCADVIVFFDEEGTTSFGELGLTLANVCMARGFLGMIVNQMMAND